MAVFVLQPHVLFDRDVGDPRVVEPAISNKRNAYARCMQPGKQRRADQDAMRRRRGDERIRRVLGQGQRAQHEDIDKKNKVHHDLVDPRRRRAPLALPPLESRYRARTRPTSPNIHRTDSAGGCIT